MNACEIEETSNLFFVIIIIIILLLLSNLVRLRLKLGSPRTNQKLSYEKVPPQDCFLSFSDAKTRENCKN